MSIWFAAALLVAAITATYLLCIRPMLRGECGAAGQSPDQPTDRDRELAELRREVARLREEQASRQDEPRERDEPT